MKRSPKKKNYPEKRKYVRLKSIFPVEFRVIDEDSGASAWHQGYTCNVSEGGICLETAALDEKLLHPETSQSLLLELSMHIPLRRPPISARARVMWYRQSGEDTIPHYLLGLQFSSIGHSDCDRLVSQARWFSFSTRSLVVLATVLCLGLAISSFYGYRLRLANERLVDHLVRAQQEETHIRQIIDTIDEDKKILSKQMRKYAEGLGKHRKLRNEYEELVQRETRINDRLALLEDQKGGMQKTILNKMHQWLKNHQNPLTGLVLSFEGNVGVVKDWAFIYDQALAAHVFLLFDNERDTRRILNFFKRIMPADFKGFHNAYYYDSGDVAEHAIHCGPNIWIGIAIMHYIEKTGDEYYLPMAVKIADWLISIQDKDPAGGLKGGPEVSWFSTEHNLDAYAFFGMMADVTSEERYKIAQKKVLSWLQTYALIPNGKDYAAPPINRGRGDATIATDTFAWSLAALGPKKLKQMGMDPEEIMSFAEEQCKVDVFFERPSGVVMEVSGFDFAKHADIPRGGVISPEWTAQMIVSYQILSRYFDEKKQSIKANYYSQKADTFLDELNKLIISSPSAKGQGEGCLPYATMEDADTGHGWRTPLGTRTCSVAGTAYMIMAIKHYNPLGLK